MQVVSRTPDTLHLSFSSDLTEVDHACREAQSFVSSWEHVHDHFFILLALREALTNAVLHGNQSNPNLSVECFITVCEDELAMRIRDQGNGFDWRTRGLELPEPESESGRGLAIIKTCFDQIEFNDSGNEIIFRKTLDPRGGVRMFDIVQDGASATATIKEDLVGSRIETARNKLSSLVEQGVKTLIIDLKNVQVIDSLGMGLLVATHNSLKTRRGQLSLINVDPKIYDVLSIMRLDKHFPISKA